MSLYTKYFRTICMEFQMIFKILHAWYRTDVIIEHSSICFVLSIEGNLLVFQPWESFSMSVVPPGFWLATLQQLGQRIEKKNNWRNKIKLLIFLRGENSFRNCPKTANFCKTFLLSLLPISCVPRLSFGNVAKPCFCHMIILYRLLAYCHYLYKYFI